MQGSTIGMEGRNVRCQGHLMGVKNKEGFGMKSNEDEGEKLEGARRAEVENHLV